jgi:hypothetical protein
MNCESETRPSSYDIINGPMPVWQHSVKLKLGATIS